MRTVTRIRKQTSVKAQNLINCRHCKTRDYTLNASTRTRCYRCYMGQKMKNNAETCGRPFTLTEEDVAALMATERCQSSGHVFRVPEPNPLLRMSPDRIDACRGYEPGNVRMVCAGLNRARWLYSEAQADEFVRSLQLAASEDILCAWTLLQFSAGVVDQHGSPATGSPRDPPE